jgi:hypothetical protein
MAASMTSDFTIRLVTPAAATSAVRPNRRRRITPQAGRAIEILGHAIEYLTDEFILRGVKMTPGSGELEAVQMLMALNRQVYFECPEAVTVVDRLRSALHLRAA